MSDWFDRLNSVLIRLRARYAAGQELWEMEKQIYAEDLQPSDRVGLEEKVEVQGAVERDRFEEVNEDVAVLQEASEAKLGERENALLAQCIETLLDLDENVPLSAAANSNIGSRSCMPWVEQAAGVLEQFAVSSQRGPAAKRPVVKCIDKFIGRFAGNAVLLTVPPEVQVLGAMLWPSGAFWDSALTLIRHRLECDEPLSVKTFEDSCQIVEMLRIKQREADAQNVEHWLSPRELEALERGINQFRNKELAARLLVKHSQRVDAGTDLQEKARWLQILQAVPSEDMGSPFYSFNDLLGNWIADSGEDGKASVKALLPQLAATLWLAKIFRALGDKGRMLHYVRAFVEFCPSSDIWEELDVNPPWTRAEEKLIHEWHKELVKELHELPKPFEQLPVAEITAADAKQIQEHLRNLPKSLAEELTLRKLVPDVGLDEITVKVRTELGSQAWLRLRPTSKQALLTAEVALRLPTSSDFSCASALYWKCLEVDLRERVFLPLWLKRPQLHVNVANLPWYEAQLAKFLREKDRNHAETMLTLKPMLMMLSRALDAAYCAHNEASALLRQTVLSVMPLLAANTAVVNFSALASQVENLRNPAIHARATTRQESEQSRTEVFAALKNLG